MTSSISRRSFLHTAAWTAAGVYSFRALQTEAFAAARAPASPLLPDPNGLLDLPEGFTYKVIARLGDKMSDGFFVPERPDGMAAFTLDGAPNSCAVVCNHEIRSRTDTNGPFGPDHALASRLEADKIFDRAPDGRPVLGGTTTYVWNTEQQALEKSYLSLVGTSTNCAGGPTPWGSWISCEETLETPSATASKAHGFNFEVPADSNGVVTPIPLAAMGRFKHEAVAVDPATGVLYQTEDYAEGLFYRFLPNSPEELVKGGKLQALAVRGAPAADTRNWTSQDFPVGTSFEVDWVDLEDVEAPDGDLAERGAKAGAAMFARGEGVCYAYAGGRGEIFFACTSGGREKFGQIWRYIPSAEEGQSGEAAAPGRLDLFYESTDDEVMHRCDNIIASPAGDIMICEDGSGDNYVRRLTREGQMYDFARNAHPDKSELCGVCFSPDGSTMFVNIQKPGIMLAVTGESAGKPHPFMFG